MKTWQQELDDLCESNGGLLKPEAVVEFAANPATALHARFDWDDAKAARQHRLDQAERLIRVYVKVIDGPSKEPVRVFVSLPSDRRQGGGYRQTVRVLTDEEQTRELLLSAAGELGAAARKYRSIKELASVVDAIDEFVRTVETELEPAESAVAVAL